MEKRAVASKWRDWVTDRFGLTPIKKQTLDRRVAKAPWYYGDGATMTFLLGVLVITGMAMTLTYSPSPDAAYHSVRYITEKQFLGWFIRGLHYWSAGLMVVMLVLHLFRQILLGGYKSPREGTWLIGVFLFFAVLIMSFTGYILRWDERAVYALKVALHMFERLPWIGEGLVVFIQGGEQMGATTLTRLFAVHVIFVPLLLLLLVGWHVYLVILHGITSRRERQQPVHSAEEQKKLYKEQAESEELGEQFHPQTTAKSSAMALVVFGVALALTLIFGPAQLMPEANLVERSFPAEEWWWWWYSGLIALLPPAIAPAFYVLFPIALFLILVLLPFLDRSPHRGVRKRPVAVAVVLFCAVALLFLSDLRRRSTWTGWPMDEPPPVPPGIELTEHVEQGRQLFAQHGCNSCHSVAGHGRRFAVDLATLAAPLSLDEIRDYVLQPPEGIPMPPYKGRISDEDLQRIVEFVHVAQTFPRER